MRSVHCGSGRGGPSVTDFYSDVAYGSRQSYEVITKMANETASSLNSVKSMLTPILKTGREVLCKVESPSFVCSVEEEEKLASNFLSAEENLCKVIDQLQEQENDAVCDPKLNGKNEKTVTTAYRTTIKKVKELIKVTQDIRWAVMEHAEDYGKISGNPMTADELSKSIG